MPSTDPIADVLTKLRNASRAKHATVDVRASRLTERVLDVMKQEGFIRNYKRMGSTPPTRALKVYLKYAQDRPALTQLVRISKPGQRVYRKSEDLPRVLGGLGMAIVSTSGGVITERDAYRQHVGGEVLCYVW